MEELNKNMKAYRGLARKHWRRAEWITGEGPYALLAHCGNALTITLWHKPESAKNQKDFIDKFGCGSRCSRCHEILDLREAMKYSDFKARPAVVFDAWNTDIKKANVKAREELKAIGIALVELPGSPPKRK